MKKFLSLLLVLFIMLGMATPAGAANAKAVTMRVQLVEGSVTIKDASGVTLTFSEDMQLYSGYSVSTGDDSCAYISLDDSKAIKLDMNTSVTVKKSGRKLQVKLIAGQIVFNVTSPLEGSEALEIRTGTMVTGIRGSSGGVSQQCIFYGTGHGRIHRLGMHGLTVESFEIWGGQLLELFEDGTSSGIVPADVSDLSALYLGEVADNEDLQQHLKQEGNYDVDGLIAQAPIALAAEQKAHDAAALTVTAPQDESGIVIPAFGEKVPTPVIPYVPEIPDIPVIPDQPEPEVEPVSHTVTWMDGTDILQTDSYPVGAAITPLQPTKTGYAFAGWDGTVPASMPDQDLTFYAQWTRRTYTITWNNGDDVFRTDTYDYGIAIADPGVPEKTGFTFTGWDAEIPVTMPAEDLTFNAQWTANTYTITWKNGDDVFRTDTYDYGIAIADPGVPEKTGFTFTGWDAEIPGTMPAEDLTFNAQWTANTYTVTWKNGDTVIKTESYDYNSNVTAPDDPEMAETDDEYYVFAGWDKDLAPVTADVTYNATFDSYRIYHVSFYPGSIPEMLDSADIDFAADSDQLDLTFYEEDIKGTNADAWAQAQAIAHDVNGFAVLIGWINAEDQNAYLASAYPPNDSNMIDLAADIYIDDRIVPDAPALEELDLAAIFGDNATSETPYKLYGVWTVTYDMDLMLIALGGETLSFVDPFDSREYSYDNSANVNQEEYVHNTSYLYFSHMALPVVTVTGSDRSFTFWTDTDYVSVVDEVPLTQMEYIYFNAVFNGYRITLYVDGTDDGYVDTRYYTYDGNAQPVVLPREYESKIIDGTEYFLTGWYDNPELTGGAIETFYSDDQEDKVFYGEWSSGI